MAVALSPLAALPPAQARALVGVCFDVDDTVTTRGVLDPGAYGALFALRESGLKLLAVTGRPLGFAEIIARTWPVDAAIGENGAGYVARAGRALRTGYWDPVAVRTAQGAVLSRIRERVAAELPEARVTSDAWARRCDLAFDVGEEVSLSRAQVDRLLAIIAEEGAQPSVSSIHAHAQLGSHDKARAIAWTARELWGLDEESARERLMFVGDSGNDAAAFGHFVLTAGVANVRAHLDRLPVPPRFVSAASHGAGFAEIACAIVEARR